MGLEQTCGQDEPTVNGADTMKRTPATLANFFFPGAGFLILGRHVPMAILFLIGAIGLTFVELSVKTAAPDLYWPMFASVFVMNTGFAIAAWREGTPVVEPSAAA